MRVRSKERTICDAGRGPNCTHVSDPIALHASRPHPLRTPASSPTRAQFNDGTGKGSYYRRFCPCSDGTPPPPPPPSSPPPSPPGKACLRQFYDSATMDSWYAGHDPPRAAAEGDCRYMCTSTERAAWCVSRPHRLPLTRRPGAPYCLTECRYCLELNLFRN